MPRPSNVRWQIRSDYVAAFAVAIAPLLYFLPATYGALILSPDDAKTFNTPLRVAAATLIRDGYLPLWNPYIFSGMPLHGAAQAGLLFPLNWFYVVFSPQRATNLMMLATYIVAATGAYFYARRAEASIPGAIATSLIWQFSAFMIQQMGHTNILHTAAMLPWVLWAADGYVATGDRKNGFLVVVLVALQALAGHQQTFVYALLLTAAYAFVVARTSRETRRRFAFVAIFILGLALAAVQILPTFELLRNSLRATSTYEFFGSFSMPPGFVRTFFAPFVFGTDYGLIFHAPYVGPLFLGEYLAYAGLLTVMLALMAVIFRRDARTKFWAAIFGVALLLAFGRFLPFDLYRVFYQIPVLNLFRSPARHLMEVQFALAVLAGRGISAIQAQRRPAIAWTAAFAGGLVFVATCLTVTWWRPAAFHLVRDVPVTVLRAPELFVPIVLSVLSAIAIWMFARWQSRKALVGLFAVLVFDLVIYGAGSGWPTHSLEPQHELWHELATVKFLRERESSQPNSFYRILTQEIPFDPNSPVVTPTPDGSLVFPLQPDVYMMHGIENASGYDGFGLSRYSRLAGEMKVWGEITDPENSLRGDSRAIDLLNVRYLLTKPARAVAAKPASTKPAFPAATATNQDEHFDDRDLGLPPLKSGRQITFSLPPTEIDHIALLTNLSWSNNVPDHATVARIELSADDGRTLNFEMRAGDHTSEWAHDRADIHAQIKHRRAPVGTSYPVEDIHGKYEAHTYVSTYMLPSKTIITSGSISVATLNNAPDLSLSVARITMANGEQAFPLRREWLTEPAAPSELALPAKKTQASQRWQRLAETDNVTIFENNHALPRAWLASEAKVLSGAEILHVVRAGRFADGAVWDPYRVALFESPIDFPPADADQSAVAEVTKHEPNQVVVKTKSNNAAILILSENHYPGWRAYVDGHLVDTLRVNYNLRGVTLPAGEHNVEFVYRPKSVLIGAAVSMLTLIGLVAWWRRWLPEAKLRGRLVRGLREKR